MKIKKNLYGTVKSLAVILTSDHTLSTRQLLRLPTQ